MNKIWLFGASICMVLALGSCKPKQSAYKAAYEQAKEKESTAPVEVVEEEEVVEEVTPVSKPRTSNVSTRAERINAAQGEDASRLKRYSVVIGSFKNRPEYTGQIPPILCERQETFHPGNQLDSGRDAPYLRRTYLCRIALYQTIRR